MKCSIIIPVYNPGKYFDDCVNSVLKQTYKDWELLLVDDGSTDGTEDKCKEYSKNDNRIKYLVSNHGGVAHARNVGISEATGEYLLFMDNDDYWKEETLLQSVVEQINKKKVDIVMYSSVSFWPNGKRTKMVEKVDISKVYSNNKAEALEYVIKKDILTRAVWTKAIRKTLIDKHNLCFPEGQRNEDVFFTGQLILHAKSFGWCDNATYMYRKGTGVSQTDQRVSDQTIDDLQQICVEYIDYVNNHIELSELRKVYLAYISYPFAVWMMYIGAIRKDKARTKINMMKEYSYVLDNKINPYIKQVRICNKILGFGFTIRLLNLYYKMI